MTLWVNGTPIKKVKAKKTAPIIQVDPCSFRGCRSIDTEKMLYDVNGETKMIPLCAAHRNI